METLYLLTGAAGHLGSAILRQLLDQKKSVRVLVLPSEKNLIAGDFEVFYGDVRDKNTLHPFFANPQNKKLHVIHCAGIVSIASRYNQKIYETNVTGTKNILDLCIQHKVEKLVYTSSVHAIAEKPLGQTISETADFNPDNVVGLYAKTKAEATKQVLDAAKNGLDASVTHPSGIIGPYDLGGGHLTALVRDFCNHKLPAAVEGGYDFVDVRDVAQGVLACCEKGKKGECYILSGKYYSIREFLYVLHQITGTKEMRLFLPRWLVKAVAPLTEFYYTLIKQPPLFTRYSMYTLGSNGLFSNKKAQAELGYSTRSLRESLADTVEWLRANKKIENPAMDVIKK